MVVRYASVTRLGKSVRLGATKKDGSVMEPSPHAVPTISICCCRFFSASNASLRAKRYRLSLLSRPHIISCLLAGETANTERDQSG